MAIEISEGLDTVCMPRNGYPLTLDSIIKVMFMSPLFVGNWVCSSAASHSESSTYMVSPFTRQTGSQAWGLPWRAFWTHPEQAGESKLPKIQNIRETFTHLWPCSDFAPVDFLFVLCFTDHWGETHPGTHCCRSNSLCPITGPRRDAEQVTGTFSLLNQRCRILIVDSMFLPLPRQ